MISKPKDMFDLPAPFDLSLDERNDVQVGLGDLFTCMTLFGVLIGCYSFISHSAALVLCAAMLVYAILRLFPCQYGVFGGMLAFGTSVICLPLVLRFGDLTPSAGCCYAWLFR